MSGERFVVVADGTVLVSWVHSGDVAYSWFSSMMSLQSHIFRHGRDTKFLAMRYGTGGIVEARNKIVEAFLAGDEDWLFSIDTDMGFQPDTLDRLLEAADPVDRPVVGGLCFANRELEPDGAGGFATFPVPTVYRWAKNPDGSTGFVPWPTYPRDEVFQCEATGAACILIHRSVFERIAERHDGPVWYRLIANPNTAGAYSEDLSFCIRCAEIDIPIHVHTGVKTTHLKPVWLSEQHFDLYMSQAAAVGAPVPQMPLVPPPGRPATSGAQNGPNRAERRRRAKARS